MNARTDTEPTLGDIVAELGDMLAGLGIVGLVLFPFAVPMVILVVVPLLALGLLVGIAAAVVAAPAVGLRRLTRQRAGRSAVPRSKPMGSTAACAAS